MKRLLAVTVAFTLSGCAARGFDRGALRERVAGEPLQVTDADIKAALDLKPQLRFPFKLAIYLQPEPEGRYAYPNGVRPGAWRWTETDKSQMLALRSSLVPQGVLSDAFLISDFITQGTDLRSLRLAAARYGADAVLIVRGASQVDRYQNPLALLYFSIVGGWFVPGTNVDTLMMIQGAMWDVANGFLYATVESEGEDQTFGPGALLDDKDSLERSKTKALDAFDAEFLRRLRSLHGA